MTGADVIAVIILIGLAIAIAVYLLHWLYRRSSKEVSFVRSGLGGEKVVISGGAFVLPIIHNVTSVGMRTLRIEVSRSGEKSFITKNRMRVELVAEFYVRVIPTEEAVSTAARSLGNRTLDPEGLRELVQGRFVDALGIVAAKMSMDDMQENRKEYVDAVEVLVGEALAETGLELEAVSLTDLDQAALEVFNPSNAFDAEGLTQLTEQIEMRKKKRNDIEQDTVIQIRNKNLETEKRALEIDMESEFSRLQQERDISKRRAQEKTEMAVERTLQEREAEEAQIRADEELEKTRISQQQAIEKARISQEQAIEVERSLREHKLTMEVEERRKLRNDIERDTEIQIRQKNLEAEIRSLEIDKENEYSRLQQQEDIAVRRAKQKADVTREESERFRESEQAQISAQEEVKKSQITQQMNLEKIRIDAEELTKTREIEKFKQLKIEEQERDLAVSKKSAELLRVNADEETARAQAVEAEEKVFSVQEVEVAERNKSVELIKAAMNVEREAIQVTTLAKAEMHAAEDRQQTKEYDSLAARLRYEVDAAGKQLLNEAENMRSDASRRSALRMQLAGNLESIIREAVKPMQNIDGIKIMEVNGLPGFSGDQSGGGSAGGTPSGSGDGGGAGPRGGNLADNVVNSALRYRAQMPFVDNLLHEIGMSPGEISNISNILGGYDKEATDKGSSAKSALAPSAGPGKS